MTLPEVERAVDSNRRIHKSNVAMVVMVAVACVVVIIGAIVLYTKVDAKASLIRATQLQNTMATNHRSNCQDKAFNDILKDARLAFSGDHNPNDYVKAAPRC